MISKLLFAFVALLALTACAQSQSLTYEELRAYEGVFEFNGNSQLTLTGSPKDLLLYAFIGEAKYPLRPIRRDVFLNSQDNEVRFVRGEQGQIAGYSVEGDPPERLNRRLSKDIDIPEGTWYARAEASDGEYSYKYQLPEALDDGLQVKAIEKTGLSISLLKTMVESVVDETYSDVHSILILKDNALVFEEYFYEYDIDTVHQLRSATKSFISALVGIAIDKGFIPSTGERILPYFPEYEPLNDSPQKQSISIEDLLTQQSGLDCDDWDWDSAGNENKMVQTDDWVKFILNVPMAATPGTRASYCSGGVIVLGRIIEKASGMTLEKFANRYLFSPLGIENYNWHFKPDLSSSDTFCQLNLRPRDMAKFGLLIANNGKWDDRQLISEAWIKASAGKYSVLNDTDYGYLWWHQWLNVKGERFDSLLATGNGGQKIHIWPELNMVTVITGGNYNTQSPSNQILINHILSSYVQ